MWGPDSGLESSQKGMDDCRGGDEGGSEPPGWSAASVFCIAVWPLSRGVPPAGGPITGREGCLLTGTRLAVGCCRLAGLFSREVGWAAGRGAAGCRVGAGSREAASVRRRAKPAGVAGLVSVTPRRLGFSSRPGGAREFCDCGQPCAPVICRESGAVAEVPGVSGFSANRFRALGDAS